jgi:hypothetical protein
MKKPHKKTCYFCKVQALTGEKQIKECVLKQTGGVVFLNPFSKTRQQKQQAIFI